MSERQLDILLVEDSARDAELVERTLRRGGIAFTARRVETERAMRAALAGAVPDIILADYHLPAFDGMSALRIARDLAPHVPFIFVSGSLGEDRAVQALHDGATDYIAKDRPTRLPSAVERAIRERDHAAARASMEASLVESERRLRLALEATRDVIFDYDMISGAVYVNSALREQWGIHPAPSTLPAWLQHVHPEDRRRVEHSVLKWFASTSQERNATEYRLRRGDGTYGIAVDRSLAVRDRTGRPVRIVGAIQDVTESRRLSEQLERSARVESLGRLAATVAHEFNNVLMSIQPYAEMIRRSNSGRASVMAEKIMTGVGRGRLIVDEIQRMTRVAEPRMTSFDVAEWLRGLRAELTAIAGAADLVVQTGEDPVRVRCDSAQLQQVIANLTSNARDAVAAGGRIVIAVRTLANGAELSVSDNGHGMPPEIAAHIFEPLFTTKRTGTGLGLSVSHRIVTQNGGTMTVETAPGAGTTFRLCLPLCSASAEAPSSAEVRHRGRAAMRVLIVEDNPSVAEGLSMLLEQAGIESSVVGLGAEAVAAAETTRPDVVLLDVSLPDIDGTEVFDRLIARWPDLPVVFASGHVEQAGLGSRTGRPNVVLLRKPFALDELLDVLEEIA